MSDFKVRGYTILQAAGYLRQEGGEQAIAALSPALRSTLQTATPTSWQPAEHITEMLHAVARLGNGVEEKARQHLEQCGEYQARASTSTFLKLVMRVLTPSMLAKKAPSLFARDCTGGSIAVELFNDHMIFRLKDMEVFEHFAPCCVGYNRFVLQAMGMKLTKTTLHGWALDKPSGSDLWFVAHWDA